MLSTAILVSVVVSSAPQTLPPEALAVTEADVFLALDLQRPGLEAVKAAVARGDLPQRRQPSQSGRSFLMHLGGNH